MRLRLGSAKPRLAIFGFGAHAHEIHALVTGVGGPSVDFSGFFVEDGYEQPPERWALTPEDFRTGRITAYICGVGDAATRERWAGLASGYGLTPFSLVSRDSLVVSPRGIGPGAVVFPNTVISVDASLGQHVHVNYGVSVSHGCSLGEFSTVSPGVTLAGDVTLGKRSFIGAGATVLPRTVVGADAIVGGGAVVTKDVPAGVTVKGNPAREAQ